MKNGDKPTFPIEYDRLTNIGTMSKDVEFGLTKREYFAGLAMQSILSTMDFKKTATIKEWEEDIYAATNGALKIADELLKQLENSNTKNQDDRN